MMDARLDAGWHPRELTVLRAWLLAMVTCFTTIPATAQLRGDGWLACAGGVSSFIYEMR